MARKGRNSHGEKSQKRIWKACNGRTSRNIGRISNQWGDKGRRDSREGFMVDELDLFEKRIGTGVRVAISGCILIAILRLPKLTSREVFHNYRAGDECTSWNNRDNKKHNTHLRQQQNCPFLTRRYIFDQSLSC